VRAGGCVTEMI